MESNVSTIFQVKLTGGKKKADVTHTACSVAVVSEIALVKAALDARLLPHLVNLRHAQLRVGSEK